MHPELSKRLFYVQFEEALRLEGLFGPRVQVEQVGYPELYVRYLNARDEVRLLRFDCVDYDFHAMDVEPVDPVTRRILSPSDWPLRNRSAFPSHNMKGGAPFLCIQGTRGYYTHEHHRPSVTGERWEKHRSSFRVRDVLALIAGKFRSGEWM